MAIEISIVNYEDRVRSLLGVNASTLGNEVVNYYEYKGLAELTIKACVPDWESFYLDKIAAESELAEDETILTDDIPGQLLRDVPEEYAQEYELVELEEDIDWQAIADECDKNINLFESCIVLKTALRLVVVMQSKATKTLQTTDSKVEYFGVAMEFNINTLNETLGQMLRQLNGIPLDDLQGLSLFSVTNPDRRRDDRGSAI